MLFTIDRPLHTAERWILLIVALTAAVVVAGVGLSLWNSTYEAHRGVFGNTVGTLVSATVFTFAGFGLYTCLALLRDDFRHFLARR